jgi:hypothetical protein
LETMNIDRLSEVVKIYLPWYSKFKAC